MSEQVMFSKLKEAKALFEKGEDAFTDDAVKENSTTFREIVDLINKSGVGTKAGFYMTRGLIDMIIQSKQDQADMADLAVKGGWERYKEEHNKTDLDKEAFKEFKKDFFIFLFELVKILS